MELRVNNEVMQLLPEKAMLWKEAGTIILSDIHLGKIVHFRKEGVPVPVAGVSKNFERLDALLKYNPERLIITGDLFHSTLNNEWDLLLHWLSKNHALQVHIIAGNHDRHTLKHYDAAGIIYHPVEFNTGGFCFRHQYAESNQYIISGHVHPAVYLNGPGRQHLKFPCFYFTRTYALLPSFGYFTGSSVINPDEDAKVIAIVNDKLIDASLHPVQH